MLEPRHIQNLSEGGRREPHWGYGSRVVPCKVDAVSCAYLDVVYRAHDLGLWYMAILWATLLAILFVWAVLSRTARPAAQTTLSASDFAARERRRGTWDKLLRTGVAVKRRFLLPDANRFLFGRTTRFQVLVLALLAGYLIIWTFLGITYGTWLTPVKDRPDLMNRRTSLGPWANRIGVIAFALTPLSILLGSRESLLSVLTGLPYQSFNFLHRWLGYVIVVQSLLHTVSWLVIRLSLYQPQPESGLKWIAKQYVIWGLVAVSLLVLLLLQSTPWGIRLTGYEFFRKAHYVLAMVYIGACWAHWNKLECFLIPAFVLWGLDRGARLVRTALLHHHPASSGWLGFAPAVATMTRFPDSEDSDVLRLDLENEQDPWKIGQHYFLCFPELSIWQSHPFDPLNVPVVKNAMVKHSYILRSKSGETRKLAQLARKKAADGTALTTPVILTGGYGENLVDKLHQSPNVVCVAGGTGIAYVLPVLLHLARAGLPADRKIQLIWAIRHAKNVDWVAEEMAALREAQKHQNLTLSFFATRDAADSSESSHNSDCDEKAAKVVDAGSSSSNDNCSSDPTSASGSDLSVHHLDGGSSEEKERHAEHSTNGSTEKEGHADHKIMGDESTEKGRHPNLGKALRDFVEATVSGRTVVFASGPGGMISDLRSIVACLNVPSKTWKRQERYDVELVCDDRLEW